MSRSTTRCWRILGCTLCLAFLWMPSARPDASKPARVLWEIGKADKSAGEFALAPGAYADFKQDGVFIVGATDPKTGWPYVHPGPKEVWAGERPHTFSILFHLKSVSGKGECSLEVEILDTASEKAPDVEFRVNGKLVSDNDLPDGTGEAVLQGDFSKGQAQHVKASFPVSALKKGDNEITITTGRGSWFIYDRVALLAPRGTKLAKTGGPCTIVEEPVVPQVLVERGGQPRQLLRWTMRHYGAAQEASVKADGMEPVTAKLENGQQTLEMAFAPVDKETPVEVRLFVADREAEKRKVLLKPVRKWTVYLMHHTHLDIGYTHVQTEVESKQWEHIEKALQLVRDTAAYPPEARFKWLPEGLWAVDSYLKQASPENKKEFIDAIKAGSIGLDALYGNELTALCRPEELIELTGCARRLEKEYGIRIDSAMISDVPGYTWGLIPVLAQSGVKFFSIGPNTGSRIGHTLSEWGGKPFYWMSPAGDQKVLCWMDGKGYSWFHSGALREESKLLEYLSELDAAKYPYDLLPIRYNIGGDNGPPDAQLPAYVRAWNEKYLSPKLVLATPSEALGNFEQRYGGQLPKVSGDFTPYWEDGAGSSALETGLNRAAAERIVQAQGLWAMLDPKHYPAAAFQEAWRNVILYDEHTWGAHNSITEPKAPFVLSQWKIKQSFALEAEKQSRALLDAAAKPKKHGEIHAIHVFNTNNWPRTDLVILPKGMDLPGDRVEDAKGHAVPSQRLSTGELSFLAENVPALGAAAYTIEKGNAKPPKQPAKAHGMTLSNGLLDVSFGGGTGAIASMKSNGYEWVNREAGTGLNDYFYESGRDPKSIQGLSAANISVKEKGPLVASLVAESAAPGCRKLSREITLVAGIDRLDIENIPDKENVYTPESVHFAFPFRVPEGVTRMDLPWSVVRPDADQLPGSCKNYFTVQRWVDVSNQERGVTWAVNEAPMLEFGAITVDYETIGWLTETRQPTTTLYSYVMNNYWETNYKASQEGPTPFRYSLQPHGTYDAAHAQRFGIERSQPLIAVPVEDKHDVPEARVRVDGDGVVVTAYKPSDDGKALILRLFNATETPRKAKLIWNGPVPKHVELSDISESPGKECRGTIELAPWQFVTVRAVEH